MIEVNLHPGATRRPQRRRQSRKLPSLKGALGNIDRLLVFAVAGWILGPGLIGAMSWSTSRKQAELKLDLEKATQDSAHYAVIIKTTDRLKARRDTIARKLELIQDIDANRYIWPHILDEISRVIPDYTWLITISQVPDTTVKLPKFQINGRTGNTFALTEFMKDLEASPFIKDVRLLSTSMVQVQGKQVHAFSLRAQYEAPPPDAIQTVPLFKPEE